jgi:hypothetical protein
MRDTTRSRGDGPRGSSMLAPFNLGDRMGRLIGGRAPSERPEHATGEACDAIGESQRRSWT